MGVHNGHRERLRKRFLQEGLEGFEDHEVLELLLFYALPRVDTNEIGHLLTNRFGSINGVFCATMEELMDVEGVGKSAATLLQLSAAMVKRSLIEANKDVKYIFCPSEAKEYLRPFFLNARHEMLYILCLDVKSRIAECRCMGEGEEESVKLDVRAIVDVALRSNAKNVIMAHNHLNGLALPSLADNASTEAVKEALEAVRINLADHLVFAGGDCVSYCDSGVL